MTAQWYATLFAWALTALLILTGFTFWAAIAAIIGFALVVSIAITSGITVAVRRLRRAGREIDELIDDVVKRHPAGSKLPGPDRPQPSGAGRDSDTRVHRWTPAQLAFIHGETDTLPAATDIPEENPS